MTTDEVRGHESLRIEFYGGALPPPVAAPSEHVHIQFSRQQEAEKAQVLVLTGLADAQQKQIVGQSSFYHGPDGSLSVVRELLDGMLGVVIVPGHHIMVEEGEQLVLILDIEADAVVGDRNESRICIPLQPNDGSARSGVSNHVRR